MLKTKHEKLVFLLAIFILSLGIYISITCNDWVWISRSGALLVMLGIWFAAKVLADEIPEKFVKFITVTFNSLRNEIKNELEKEGAVSNVSTYGTR